MIAAAVAVAAILAGSYPASAWYFGRQIEAAHAEMDAKITALPYLKLVRHDYERRLFDATEVVTIEIPAALLRPPARPKPADVTAEAPAETPPDAKPATPPAPFPPLRVTVRTSIQHGPFPGLNTLASGSAHSVLEFEEPLQKKVLEAFGGKPPLEIRTLYDFQGGGRSTLTSPPFKLIVPGDTENRQAVVSGDGVEMTGEFTRGLERYSVLGSARRFEITDPNGMHLVIAGLGVESRQQKQFPDEPLLYTGSQQVSLSEFSIDPGASDNPGETPKIALKDLKYDVQTPAAGEFVDVIARFGAAGLLVGEKNYGPANYDISLRHLNARKAMKLYRDVMAVYARPEVMQDPEKLMPALAPMKDQLVALLVDSPVVSIDRISFRTPEGEAKVSASVRLADAKAEDFANPMMLLAKLDAAADLALPTALISAMAGGKGASEEEAELRKQNAEQTIGKLVQQGFATLDAGQVKSRITFKAGQLLVNDKPFNPMALAQAQ